MTKLSPSLKPFIQGLATGSTIVACIAWSLWPAGSPPNANAYEVLDVGDVLINSGNLDLLLDGQHQRLKERLEGITRIQLEVLRKRELTTKERETLEKIDRVLERGSQVMLLDRG